MSAIGPKRTYLVRSRPSGNTTGLTILAPELSAKRLEVLSEIVPGLSRVAALWDPTSSKSQVAMTETAARAMKIQLQILEVKHRDHLVGAFAAAREGKAQAINILASPILASLTHGSSLCWPPNTVCQRSTNGENKLKPGDWCPMGQISP